MDTISMRKIIKYRNGKEDTADDEVVNEMNLTLSINFKNLTVMTCSPDYLEDLTSGYLVTSGIITEENPLKGMKFDHEKDIMYIELEDNSVIKDMIFSKLRPVGCGYGTLLFSRKEIPVIKTDEVKIKKDSVSELMQEFNKASDVFMRTGGVHSAAVSDGRSILIIREDIGRHNALDKAIGSLYLSKHKLNNKIILTSGRISSEIMLKLIYAGIPAVISRSAPTSAALDLAEKYGITVIGFARSTNFNVYTNPERIIFG